MYILHIYIYTFQTYTHSLFLYLFHIINSSPASTHKHGYITILSSKYFLSLSLPFVLHFINILFSISKVKKILLSYSLPTRVTSSLFVMYVCLSFRFVSLSPLSVRLFVSMYGRYVFLSLFYGQFVLATCLSYIM